MPVAFGNQRITDKDIVLSGYQIPKGVMNSFIFKLFII
jgi:cytochrome P450